MKKLETIENKCHLIGDKNVAMLATMMISMIKGFVHKGLEQFFATGSKAGIQPRHASKLRLILAQLNQARVLEDLNAPALGLHSLRGDRQGQWAVTVQANWRVTFKFENGDADAVNYEDYH